MGTYTDRARVRARAAKLPEFSATTTITADEVDAMIVDVEAEIEVAFLARSVAVPVTSPPALLAWIVKLATEGAAATVLKAWFQDSTGPNSEGAWAVYERRYQDGLKAIRAGQFPTGVDESADEGVSSFQVRYPDGETAGTFGAGAEPMFRRDMDW